SRPSDDPACVRNTAREPDWTNCQHILRDHRARFSGARRSKGGGVLKRMLSPANLALAGGLFALSITLNIPLFEPGEGPYRGSIEAGYASMARFFANNPNPWGWNPLQYCGMPAQFTYVPALPYLAAAASRRTSAFEVDHVYRIIASGFACLGPATLFLLVLYF